MKTANFEAFAAKIETGFLFQNGQLSKRPTLGWVILQEIEEESQPQIFSFLLPSYQ